ncbi:NADH-ubiquinone oxidoreductase subunit NDUFA12 family protein [Teichococcus vastitatis]|uniref:NADH-ubiquinone oxidoreductase subunit NDUFA12 family protein n=1 Tax=Teichococcus vastitatis TaxID=2307076 RepID=A0ABS9WAS0_9PROT|nr:NADH-ubiquinone oxidoreductase subunit NDUFA12 family protein [Pseudoroseomonas vastitatis]MCI0756397.1 NADH-ubiquinone oxidoreductase subunit NDUFA12 family protein [Pseudoroseomonas vastitatis]
MSFLQRLTTGFGASKIGTDRFGNTYYESRKSWLGYGRKRRFVVYAGEPEPTTVPPEWHCWLHHVTDAPLPEKKLYPWQEEHRQNRTGTALAYRPPAHEGGGERRPPTSGDYEAWTPGS